MHEGNNKITTWVELVDKFFYKYYPLSRASRINCTDEERYDNNALADDDESSEDENNESDHQDANPIPDPYLSDKEKEQLDDEMCRVDRFEVIKYSIGDNKEFMRIVTLDRHSWARTTDGVSSVYLDIFRKKDNGLHTAYPRVWDAAYCYSAQLCVLIVCFFV
ncbi:hypothetical protein Tco_1341344, partial [Tanacetum coccineum]